MVVSLLYIVSVSVRWRHVSGRTKHHYSSNMACSMSPQEVSPSIRHTIIHGFYSEPSHSSASILLWHLTSIVFLPPLLHECLIMLFINIKMRSNFIQKVKKHCQKSQTFVCACACVFVGADCVCVCVHVRTHMHTYI